MPLREVLRTCRSAVAGQRSPAGIILILLLSLLVLVSASAASPSDPRWDAGIYDLGEDDGPRLLTSDARLPTLPLLVAAVDRRGIDLILLADPAHASPASSAPFRLRAPPVL